MNAAKIMVLNRHSVINRSISPTRSTPFIPTSTNKWGRKLRLPFATSAGQENKV